MQTAIAILLTLLLFYVLGWAASRIIGQRLLQALEPKKSCQLPASSSQLLKISNLAIDKTLPRLTHSVKFANSENLDKTTAGG